ncbi:MAG: thioredoxin [Rikenellaceae bacterium]|nr:thioredoxin [Rikenellaceae bacterium]
MALEITTNNLEELIASGKPVVIDFWAEWCGPCRMLTPIIEELAGEYENDVIIGKCNVDDNNDVSMKYGIRNIPTVIFLKGGEVVDKHVGACSKAALAEKIEKLK